MTALPHQLIRRLTPEEEELHRKRAELAALEDRLADRELELSTLHARLEQFRSRYMTAVGRRYAELDRIEAEIARLIAAKNPADPHAAEEARFRRQASEESARESEGFDQEPSVDQGRFTPSAELKNLFRMIAKAMHPDLAVDEDDRARRSSDTEPNRFAISSSLARRECLAAGIVIVERRDHGSIVLRRHSPRMTREANHGERCRSIR